MHMKKKQQKKKSSPPKAAPEKKKGVSVKDGEEAPQKQPFFKKLIFGEEKPDLTEIESGSTTILVAVVKGKDVTKESINAAMKAASSESFGYNTDEIVSSDVIGIRYGSLFDATQTMVTKLDDDTYQVQVVSWYDNENSYTSQMVRTIKYFAELA